MCYLVSQRLHTGVYETHDLQKDKLISYKLLPGQSETMIFEQSYSSGPEVILNYECGEGEVSFSSVKSTCLQGGMIDASLLSAANMTAKFEVHPGNYWQQKRAQIDWSLSEQ